jgi:hypothetical protein
LFSLRAELLAKIEDDDNDKPEDCLEFWHNRRKELPNLFKLASGGSMGGARGRSPHSKKVLMPNIYVLKNDEFWAMNIGRRDPNVMSVLNDWTVDFGHFYQVLKSACETMKILNVPLIQPRHSKVQVNHTNQPVSSPS